MGRSGFGGQAEEWERFLEERGGAPPFVLDLHRSLHQAAAHVKSDVRARRDDPEHREAVKLMQLVDAHTKTYPKLELFYHQDNGRATRAQGGKKAAEGVKPGVADYFLPVAVAGFHGLFLELKAPGKRPTPAQLAFLVAMRDEGFAAEWVEGGLYAWHIIKHYMEESYEPRPI